MRSSFALERASTLIKTPSARQQSMRRRLAAVCAVLGLALASGLTGWLTHPAVGPAPSTGPFSYFPSQ